MASNKNNHIKDFLDNQYVDYAVYRVYQRLPNIIDCLGQTQRKILYTMAALPEIKKPKTAEVYSHVYTTTQYLHGDKSVYTVTENLARSCSNNINLLTEEGSFGYRTKPLAASPRYTSTRFSKVARLIFRREDEPILYEQEFEGKKIEPQFMLPIIPTGLVNGFLGIAVGFSSKFLPRDPIQLINETIRILQYRKKHGNIDKIKIKELQPNFPYYTGNIIRDTEHENPSSWLLLGNVKKTKTRNIIEVTEVPPSYTRESYLKKLKSMLVKGIIKDFSDECRKNKFYFRIKLTPEMGRLSEDEIIQKLSLVDTYTENFTFIDSLSENPDETIHKFNNAEEYLRVFMEKRQYFYTIRKQYQLEKLQNEIDILKQRIKFIATVNSGSIIITKRKKIDLEKELQTLKYLKIEDSFDYLLGMKMHALTEENIKKFSRFIKDRELELKTLKDTTPEDIHIGELRELKKFLEPELKKKGIL